MTQNKLKPLSGIIVLLVSTILWASYDLHQISKFYDKIAEPLKYQKIFFSRKDNIPALLTTLINKEKNSIKAAYYSFSLDSVADALIKAQKKGIDVQIILDSSCLSYKPALVNKLYKAGIKIFIYYSPFKEFKALMHHKFMIFEKQENLPAGGVATGSFNCTRAAAERHWENLVILEGPDATNLYVQEFSNLINECKPYLP